MEKIARAICLPDTVGLRINLTANQTIDNRLLGRAAKGASPASGTTNTQPLKKGWVFVLLSVIWTDLRDELPVKQGVDNAL